MAPIANDTWSRAYQLLAGRLSGRLMMQPANSLMRPRRGRMLGGVAIGLAYRFGLPVWFVRLIWLLLFLPGGLPGIVPYLILWIVMPSE